MSKVRQFGLYQGGLLHWYQIGLLTESSLDDLRQREFTAVLGMSATYVHQIGLRLACI